MATNIFLFLALVGIFVVPALTRHPRMKIVAPANQPRMDHVVMGEPAMKPQESLEEKKNKVIQLIQQRYDENNATRDWSERERGLFLFAKMMDLPALKTKYSVYSKFGGREADSDKQAGPIIAHYDIKDRDYYRGAYKTLLGREPREMELRLLHHYIEARAERQDSVLVNMKAGQFATILASSGIFLTFFGGLIGGLSIWTYLTFKDLEDEDDDIPDSGSFEPLESSDDSSSSSGDSDTSSGAPSTTFAEHRQGGLGTAPAPQTNQASYSSLPSIPPLLPRVTVESSYNNRLFSSLSPFRAGTDLDHTDTVSDSGRV